MYEVPEAIDLRQIADLGSELSVVYRNVNQAGDVLILITRARSRPKWSANDKIVNAEYRLFVIHFDRAHQLLFINASQSLDGIYESLANQIEPRARTAPENTTIFSKRRHANGMDAPLPWNRASNFTSGLQTLGRAGTQFRCRVTQGRPPPQPS